MPLLVREIRLTLHEMGEERDRLLLEREVPWLVEYSEIDGEVYVERSFAAVNRRPIAIPYSNEELAAYFAKQKALAAF